ncbi:MAG TPA: hypothetical protein DCX27_16605, partial [Balneola sp.]|nr:hypothetical protein [Balneola sp.]
KHAIFASYTVDEFWSKIEKLEIIYFHGKKIIYSLNLSNYLTIASPMEVVKDSLPTPSVKLKTKKTSEK